MADIKQFATQKELLNYARTGNYEPTDIELPLYEEQYQKVAELKAKAQELKSKVKEIAHLDDDFKPIEDGEKVEISEYIIESKPVKKTRKNKTENKE
jgi:hypothetical protein